MFSLNAGKRTAFLALPTPVRCMDVHNAPARHGVSPAPPDSYFLRTSAPPPANGSCASSHWYRVHHRCYLRAPKAPRIFSPDAASLRRSISILSRPSRLRTRTDDTVWLGIKDPRSSTPAALHADSLRHHAGIVLVFAFLAPDP
ncbi:hypothetical protein C8R44DRAFT_878835 [Mycena epipterygia]|nr:hypothetical protein C8R44DRAFT_878835 [Mycena epipterygia]